MVSVTDETTISQNILDVTETAMTKEVVRFLHASLGNPTRATLLTAAQNGNLVTFPGMTPENISQHFPESTRPKRVT
jgi:hypothetical protein